ncbi:unnamed protein product [Rotaria sp. Silwood1]|nr:unnamed protein product [Rotaria sp. Silwood1]CAF5024773.1 unnamed protein product [Rotaria sp. Silwood1]
MTNFNLSSTPLNEIQNYEDYKIVCHRKILRVLINFFEYVSYYNDFPQIQSIYVLERNLQNINYENQTYSKRVNTFIDDHTLIERLREDILLTYRNDLSISISSLQEMTNQQSLTNLDQNTFMFLWNHLFIYYLVNSSDIDMNKFKKSC